jgi:[histone H3]-N6,N6-dimethyl-L-lysine4 FAD-dependent demethylase
LEARSRTGGRVNTKKMAENIFVEEGASIMTGTIGNPLYNIIAKNNNIKTHVIGNNGDIYDIDGKVVNKEVDKVVEKKFNEILDESNEMREEKDQSLGETLRALTTKYFPKNKKLENRLMNWHIANLEYGCGNNLNDLSLNHWDQDDDYELNGDHAFLPYGNSKIN